MDRTKLVIFDLDGTLVNAYPAITRSFNYAMIKIGAKPQSAGVIKRAVGWGDGNLLKPFVPKNKLDQALLIYRKHHRVSLIKYSWLFAGVHKVLRGLKNKGYKLAVASNRPTEFSLILIRHLKLKKYFDYILCADKLKKGKPNPTILKKIMQQIGTKPSETVYVGDMALDAQAGRRAKVKTIIVTTGSSNKKEISAQKPAFIIKSIKDLPKAIELKS